MRFRKNKTMLKIYKAILLCSLISLTGCAINSTKPIARDFSFDAKANTGLIIGSISQELAKNKVNSYFYLASNNDIHTSQKVKVSKNSLLLHSYKRSQFSETSGRIYALELPVGKHTLKTWSVFNGTGATITPRNEPTPIEFTVKKGEVLYVGNLHMNFINGRNLFGMSIIGSAYPELTNEYDRDISVFHDKYPGLKQHKIKAIEIKNGRWK